jgi:endonuclease-3
MPRILTTKLISERHGRKLVPRICSALESAYGKHEPAAGQGDPLDELMMAALSENSASKDASRALKELRKNFVDWNEIRVSRAGEIERAMRPLDGAGDKARRIVRVLNNLFAKRSMLSLSFLLDVGPKEARDFLAELDGVGEELAARVMLFSLGYPAVAITPHVARVTQRVGLINEESPADESRRRLEKIVPREMMYAFHGLISDHGRRACLVTKPKCSRCAIKRHCRMGRLLKSRKSRA